ncbi:MAG: hypothetical protein JXA72_13945 [Bacteroidales bacterium]|nr:hypothetical protein [Bacteroidales bacterium]
MKKFLLTAALFIIPIALSAQQRTHLPYSVFGIGELTPDGLNRSMALGRTGIALSSNRYVNNINPASYSHIDSISFLFDVGLSGDFVKYEASGLTQRGNDMNIRNIALGFRIMPKWSASIGIAPYSTVGYKVITEKYIDGTFNEEFELEMTGTGGLSRFYWDNSYLLFKRLSLGVSFTYLFGNIETTETASFSNFTNDIISKQTSYLNKVYADFGVQYYHPVNKNLDVTLGAIFGNSHKLNFKQSIQISASDGTVEQDEITRIGSFKLPIYYGGGLSVSYKNQLTLSADYLYHDWSATKSDNPDFNYMSNHSFRAGAEYVPGRVNRLGYFGSIAYRVGYYYEQSYLQIRGASAADNGISLGMGLPFMQNRTTINISYNFGVNGTMNNSMIRETYHSFLLSVAMHDWWFIKRKYD